MVTLARELPSGVVQLIVGGHDHSDSEGVVSGIPMVRAGANGRALAIVDLVRDAAGARSFTISRQTARPDDVPGDRLMTALLQRYLDAADAIGRAPVTTLAEPLSAASDRRLGHVVADAGRLAADADFGLHNPGGLRTSLPAGEVSYDNVYRVLPFGNTLVRLTLTGRQLREVVEQAGVRFYYSNLRIEQDPSAPRGRRVVSMTFADGSPVDEDRAYTLATIDFLADGGDGMTTLASLPREVVGVSSLDAVVEHLRSLPSPVRLPADERVVTARR
jgi:5'-nucleotidase